MRIVELVLCLVLAHNLSAQATTTTIPLLPGEHWWGGRTADASQMPFESGYEADLRWNNGNQVQPLLLSDQGRFVWCETTFSFAVTDSTLVITSKKAKIQQGKFGRNLREAYQFAAENLFPFKGKIPHELLFTASQYTTEVEVVSGQDQAGILEYARNVIANGLPPGVLIIDDGWQQDYGDWNFETGSFPDPKAMIDELHEMGFKVMLWMCPFVNGDSQVYQELYGTYDAFLHDPNIPGNALMIKWWNGESALLDFTHPPAERWFRSELNRLQNEYNVDGFKLEGGDFNFYHWAVPHKKSTGFAEQGELYARIGLDYPLNEYRVSFKLGGEPLAQRLHGEKFNWENLRKLVPGMTLLGIMGYPFAGPDVIGDSKYRTVSTSGKIDQELVVRSAQVHALMPMMKFGVAPWQVLDPVHLAAVKKAALLHQEFGPRILKLANESSVSGEPIVKSMEYAFPQGGHALVHDQFLLGDTYLVAPVLESGVFQREVVLPQGKWKYVPTGEVFTGPKKVTVEAPLAVLPYFERR